MNVFYLGFLPGAKGKNTTSKIFISEDYLGILKSSSGYALSLSPTERTDLFPYKKHFACYFQLQCVKTWTSFNALLAFNCRQLVEHETRGKNMKFAELEHLESIPGN